MSKELFRPYHEYREYPPSDMIRRAEEFYHDIRRRRTIRAFSDREVPQQIIEHAILAAGTAPNGANIQPWHFVVVRDAAIKRQIREEAEKVERDFYQNKITPEWRELLAPLGTDAVKAYIDTAPCLIAIFEVKHTRKPDGTIMKHYYVPESVGIATGFLIAALHYSGLATLTHTPSPMGFLNKILHRPDSERPFLLLVTGYPAEGAEVPELEKKTLPQLMTTY